MSSRNPTLWEGERLTFERSLALSLESLSTYGPLYRADGIIQPLLEEDLP